jgi:hypothetical protein
MLRATEAIRLQAPRERGGLFHDQQVMQPFHRVTESAYSSWVYKGGPRLSGTYPGDWDIPRSYPFLSRTQWGFDSAHLAEQRSTLRGLGFVGGTVGGLVYPATMALNAGYAAKTLYGANCIPPQDVFGYCDYGSPLDRNRQLSASDPPLVEGQRGTAYWMLQGNSVHYDDFSTLATLWFYGGGFGSEIESEFSVAGYGALLRSLYASDAAYVTACQSQTRSSHPPHDLAWRRHLLAYCRKHALERVRPMHEAAGIESSYNGFGATPSSWAGLCNLAIGAEAFSHLIVELNPADTEQIVAYQDGHDLGNTTRLMTWFARIQLACATMRAFGAKGTVAPYPYIRWVPPNTLSARFSTFAVQPPTFDDSPPVAGSYTEPVTVAANYRAMCAWICANGQMPALPIQTFDYVTNFLTGWQGANRMQWTADPADFAPLFAFIGAHRAALLDGFDAPVQAALAVPDLDERYSNSASNSINSATNAWSSPFEIDVGPGWDINRPKRYSRDIVSPLMTRGIPWMLALLGTGLDRARLLSDYRFADLDLVVKTETDATYTDNGTAAPTGANVQTRTWLTGTNLDPLRPVIVSGATDASRPVLATVRAHPDGRVAIHLVNTNNCTYGSAPSYTGAQVNARQATLTVRVRGDLLGPRVGQAQWFEPGVSGGRPMRMDRDADGVTITVPAPGLMDWGVILIPTSA